MSATCTIILWEEIQTCYSELGLVASPFHKKNKKNKLADFLQLSFSEISAPTEKKTYCVFWLSHWLSAGLEMMTEESYFLPFSLSTQRYQQKNRAQQTVQAAGCHLSSFWCEKRLAGVLARFVWYQNFSF